MTDPMPTPTDPTPQPAEPTPAPAPAPAEPQPAPAPADPAPQPAEPKGKPDDGMRDARIMSELAEGLKALQAEFAAWKKDGQKPEEPAADEQEPAEEAPDYEGMAKAATCRAELAQAGCIDAVGALAHVDMAAVKLLEDGGLEGLDVERLKADCPHLFRAKKTVSTGGTPGGQGSDAVAKTIADGFRLRQTTK